MLFVMDVGNSHMVLGLYDGPTLRGHWRLVTRAYGTADELRIQISTLLAHEQVAPQEITGCCVASVVPQLNSACCDVAERMFGAAPVMVGPGIKTGIVLQIENPKEVGADRIANAVAAIDEYSGPLIVVDFGTATTLDVITAKAEYRGGVIVPGVQLSADALFEKCAKLPRVDIATPPQVVGRDTVGHIRSGLTYGYADLVDGLVRRIAHEIHATPTVIATGGLAGLIAELSQTIQAVDPFLTLKGLKLIYTKNERDAA
jgi:type III pantothenate kinase